MHVPVKGIPEHRCWAANEKGDRCRQTKLSLKNRKAADIDAIRTKIFKADLHSSVSFICPFSEGVDREEIPED